MTKKPVTRRLWVYLFPALMDFSVASLLLYASIRAVQIGAGPVTVGLLGSTFGITYFISSFILGNFARKETAQAFMVISCITFILLAVCFSLFSSLAALFMLMPLTGLFTSFFFIGFQMFMGHGSGLSTEHAVAFYTLSWSTGMAIGSLAEGAIVNAGPFLSQLPVIVSSVLIIAGLRIVKGLAPNDVTADVFSSKNPVSCSTHRRFFVYIGWVSISTATLLSTGIRFLLPKLTISNYGFSEAGAGFAVFIFLIAQALSGFISGWIGPWRYAFLPHIWMKCVAIVGMIIPVFLPFGGSVFLWAGLVGIWSGNAFYNAVYYSLMDSAQGGKNIGTNEALVGVFSLVGPFLLGVMLRVGIKNFYLWPIAILFGTALIELAIFRRIKQNRRDSVNLSGYS